ncbi:hypothetical protein DVH05_022084 [Phytophthora capsici]|nr:hypothetical protein DVH05_022084 [Phytophthora capsici]
MAAQARSAQKRPLGAADESDSSEGNESSGFLSEWQPSPGSSGPEMLGTSSSANEEAGQQLVIAPPPEQTQFESWKAFESGQSGNQSGQSGESGNQSGDSGNQSGDSANQSGDSVNQSGDSVTGVGTFSTKTLGVMKMWYKAKKMTVLVEKALSWIETVDFAPNMPSCFKVNRDHNLIEKLKSIPLLSTQAEALELVGKSALGDNSVDILLSNLFASRADVITDFVAPKVLVC